MEFFFDSYSSISFLPRFFLVKRSIGKTLLSSFLAFVFILFLILPTYNLSSKTLRTASSESLRPKIEIKPTARNNEESLDSRSSNNLIKSCSSIYGVSLSCLVLLDFPISSFL